MRFLLASYGLPMGFMWVLWASYELPMGFLLASYGLPMGFLFQSPLWFSLTFASKRSTEPLSRDLGLFEGVSKQAKFLMVFINCCFETFHGTALEGLGWALSRVFLGARRRYRTLFNLSHLYSTLFNPIQPY